MTLRDNNLLNISWLCEAANVSRSGYYYWLSAEKNRLAREAQDKKDFEILLEAYRFRGYNKGARSIYMRLLHMAPPVHMNIKKIRRLMKKFGLRTISGSVRLPSCAWQKERGETCSCIAKHDFSCYNRIGLLQAASASSRNNGRASREPPAAGRFCVSCPIISPSSLEKDTRRVGKWLNRGRSKP